MKSSGCPCPASPPTPRISPRRSLNDTSSRTSSPRPSASKTTSASGATSGLPGYIRSIVRPVISVTASASSNRSRVATWAPLRRIVIRSASDATSLQRCDVKRMQAPSSRRRRTSPKSQATSCSASAEVGSSRKRMRGSRMKAPVISTIWRWASRSEPASARGSIPCTSYRSSTASARLTSLRRWIRRVTPRGSLPANRFSATVIHGKSVSS